MKESKIITTYLPKGGVGKTTITCLLAYELTKYGKVLVIDADNQGSTTFLLVDDYENEKNKGYADVLKGNIQLKDALIEKKLENQKEIYVLGTFTKDDELRRYLDSTFRDEPENLTILLQQANELDFDYILIDLPGTYGYHEKQILSKVHELIPIVEPEELSLEELKKLHPQLKKLKLGLGAKGVDYKRIIINKENSTKKVHQVYTDMLKNTAFKIYEIKDSAAISNAMSQHLTLQEYQLNNKLNAVIEQLAIDIK